MESTFDKEITLDSLQKIKAIPAMIPVVKKITSDLGHRRASYLCTMTHSLWQNNEQQIIST